MRIFACFVVICTLMLCGSAAALETGSLVVSYQTGPKAERLDRIRFWLKQGDFAQIYPKRDGFVQDHNTLSRVVVIDDLKPGTYTLEFSIPNYDGLFEEVPKRTINIHSKESLKIDQLIKPRYASLKVYTTLTPDIHHSVEPTVILKNSSGKIHTQSSLGQFTVRHLVPGHYTIEFVPLDGYVTPQPIVLNVAPNEHLGPLQGTYQKMQPTTNLEPLHKLTHVPGGKSIIGDPFSEGHQNELPSKIINVSTFDIGVYEVTNSQFAQWLNKALAENKIVYSSNEKKGQIADTKGNLLCKTLEADPYSQIYMETLQGKPHFLPVIGKHNHPVIDVSWYGAEAYCRDNLLRLPTEAEWEKAAGMAPSGPGETLKKFRYGFSRDTIDRSWANFKDNDRAIEQFSVLTSRVGLYNGVNTLADGSQTNQAISPVGAFDMSGNVWEWVQDWYQSDYFHNMPDTNPQGPISGVEKVAKGGCYDSLADGVRVSERLALPPDYADAYTGFRVASLVHQ